MKQNIKFPENTTNLILESNNRIEAEKVQLSRLATIAMEVKGVVLSDITDYTIEKDGSISIELKDVEQIKEAE